jgi:hypothetical protein
MRRRVAPPDRNGAAGDEEQRGHDCAGSDSGIGPVETVRRQRDLPSAGRGNQPASIRASEPFAEVPRHRLGLQPDTVVTCQPFAKLRRRCLGVGRGGPRRGRARPVCVDRCGGLRVVQRHMLRSEPVDLEWARVPLRRRIALRGCAGKRLTRSRCTWILAGCVAGLGGRRGEGGGGERDQYPSRAPVAEDGVQVCSFRLPRPPAAAPSTPGSAGGLNTRSRRARSSSMLRP